MSVSAKSFIIAAIAAGTWLVSAQTGVLAQSQAPPRPGTSVLKNPNPPAPPNFGWWDQYAVKASDPNASTAKATIAYSKAGGQLVASLKLSDQSAAPQFNAYSNSLAGIPAGTLLHLSYTLTGDLSQPKPNTRPTVVTTISIFGKSGGSHDIVFSPSPAGEPVLKGAAPLTGHFGPLNVSVVFALPANAEQVKVLDSITNAVGTAQITGLSLTIAEPKLSANVAPVIGFQTPEQANAAYLEKYNADWAAAKASLGIPEPEKIYTPKPALGGAHPRYLFAGLPVSEVKHRINNPAYAAYAKDLFKVADDYASAPPPAKPDMNAEDPLRDYGDRPAWIALAYTLTDDPTKKAAYLKTAVAYVDAYAGWGMPQHDLPLSQMILGMGALYDWMYADLPAATRAKARQHIINCARWMRDPQDVSALQWRGNGNWLANHKWFNYAGLAMAASVLWGDTASPLQPGETKLWMDEAMQVFWVVRKTFGPDGAPVEGYLYQSYGLRPYLDFAALAEQLTTGTPFLDTPGLRNIGISRLHSLLPNGAGFFVYADSEPKEWGGSAYFRLVASRFHDPKAQLLADIMESGEARGADVSENYDPSLPEYKAGAPAQPATSGTPIILEAETFTLSANAGSIGPKFGSHGTAIKSWDAPDTRVDKTFTIAQTGDYQLWIKYAAGGPASRALLIDNKIPFREAGYVPFTTTGGWSTDSNQWRFVAAGEEVPGVNKPWLFHLTAGAHTLSFRNDVGNGMNIDWVAFAPAGMSKEAVIAKAGDMDTHVAVQTGEATRDWHGLFWYDPAVPSAKLAAEPLSRDNDDLGVYTARSSWTDPRATFMGFKAGPVAGKGVLASIPGLWSGHSQPDEGMFEFYYGSHAVVSGSDYTHHRATTDHPVVVLEGNDVKHNLGQLIGQYGEGSQWFSNAYKNVKSSASTLCVDHTPAYHTFLADLSGIYLPAGGNNKATRDANTLSLYRRSITYLTQGVVVIVDRVEAPTPQTFRFRIPTQAKDMVTSGRAFTFTIGRTPGRIVDMSPQAYEASVTHEAVDSYRNPGSDPTNRNVATLRAVAQTNAIFAVVLGMNGAEKGITVQADAQRIVINGAASGPITLSWKMDLQPLPPDTGKNQR